MHREWLSLVDLEGPFLAVPVLKRVWPNGMPDFRTTAPNRFEQLSDARRSFETAWETLDRYPSDEGRLPAFRTARDAWVETVLRNVIGWGELLQWGQPSVTPAQSPNQLVTVTAQGALVGSDGTGALVHVVDPTDSLRETPNDLWAATPVDRLEALLRANGVRIGIVTDGRWWGLVHVADGVMTASGVVDALTWTEEPRTRDAFFTLVSRQQIVGGDPAERLPVLFEESVAAAEEITETLGSQVRQAVELLIQSFSESALDARTRGVTDPLPEQTHEIYEAAVTMMMRTVFLLFAEERGLLPSGELFEHGYGVSGELDRLSTEVAHGEEALDTTSLTWHRLLATSLAIFRGASFENLRMPAYGGSLFDPERFAFLTSTSDHGTLTINVSDRVMFHVLRSIQIVTVKGEARRISFRDIDVEQIGYIYEGLLGYTCTRVDETYLGLIGKLGSEPEITLEHLEGLAAQNPDSKKLADAIREWLKTDQPSADPPSTAALRKALGLSADPAAVSSLSQVVDGNAELITRVSPWLGAIRTDLRGQPFVVRAGGLLVAETPSRRNAGAHYTPKSLAEEVVLHALQPLCYQPGPHQTSDESAWQLRSSDDLLALKVADIACGSGAFLVAAARYLADRLVEAWISEEPRNAGRKDLHTRALRQVVASCLYGADINEMAVEMCKLSLWLVSLDRDLPFSFVDDKVFHGNSLLGVTSLDQLRKLHIDPARAAGAIPLSLFDVSVDSIITKAIDLRKSLSSEIDDGDPTRSTAAKGRQFAKLLEVTADLRRIADGVVAAGLPLGGKPGKALDDAYTNLRLAVKQAYPDGDQTVEPGWLEGLIDHGLTPTVETDYHRWRPLHWVIEVPDVLVDRGGFDAVIGNPPFLGSQKLNGAVGLNVRDWFVEVLGRGARGIADLVAYFFLRGFDLLQSGSTLGLLATNTVAQGDTREVGLDRMVSEGFEISRAVRSQPWPSSSANLEYAAVWGRRGVLGGSAEHVCDGVRVPSISSLLEPEGRTKGDPKVLVENKGVAFNGIYVLGLGFTIEKDEAEGWLEADPELGQVVRPYLIGRDLNGSPIQAASRFVIDFNDRSEDEARRFTVPFERVEELVKPKRQRTKATGGFVLAEPLPQRWWQFARTRPAMRAAIKNYDRVIAITQVSSTLMPCFVDADQVLDATLVVFASDDPAMLAFLSSDPHRLWAIKYGTTMRTDTRYTPSAIFDRLPLPDFPQDLRDLGTKLDKDRREILIRRNGGLTWLYQLVNDRSISPESDSDVCRIRELHVAIDEALAKAYGWTDIDLNHGFYENRGKERWTVCPAARAEILDRLLEENVKRSAIGPSSGSATKGSKKKDLGMDELF